MGHGRLFTTEHVSSEAMALVQECASAIEHFDSCLKEAALPEMLLDEGPKVCDDTALFFSEKYRTFSSNIFLHYLRFRFLTTSIFLNGCCT